MKTIQFGLAAVLALAATTAGAETYIREGTQPIDVRVTEGKLFCTRVSDGYEMCNGMTQRDLHTWKGRKMKHPDMPGFMKFNGTVVFSKNGLSIEGCALGICDAENWAKQ